jgi:pyruvate-formate lyase-activating enzyme
MGVMVGKRSDSLKPLIDKFFHIPWIISHFSYYYKFNSYALSKGIPVKDIVVLKFPTFMPDVKKPPILSVDLTDACNLQCLYCNNPLFPNPRSIMSDTVADSLIAQLKTMKLNRVRIGGGEPTLHPKFASILKQIAPHVRFLSIITNGQWSSSEIADQLLETGVDLIEISVDAGGPEYYERSRNNASYSKLLRNLEYLRSSRDKLKSKTMIKIRLMLRPSTMYLEHKESHKLLAYCDCVLPQWVMKHPDSDYEQDIFFPGRSTRNISPVCSLPFKDLQVKPDGNIPLCSAIGYSLDQDKRVYIGNVCNDSILSVWNGKEMKELRKAHRSHKGGTLKTCCNCNFG